MFQHGECICRCYDRVLECRLTVVVEEFVCTHHPDSARIWLYPKVLSWGFWSICWSSSNDGCSSVMCLQAAQRILMIIELTLKIINGLPSYWLPTHDWLLLTLVPFSFHKSELCISRQLSSGVRIKVHMTAECCFNGTIRQMDPHPSDQDSLLMAVCWLSAGMLVVKWCFWKKSMAVTVSADDDSCCHDNTGWCHWIIGMLYTKTTRDSG